MIKVQPDELSVCKKRPGSSNLSPSVVAGMKLKAEKGRKGVQPPNALQSRHTVACIVRYYRDGKLDLQFVCTFSLEGPVFLQYT